MGFGFQMIIATVCSSRLIPIAVISGASRGAVRSGRYASFSIVKFSAAQTTIAQSSEIAINAQPGSPESPSAMTTVQLVSAPTINTSPCAKLIRLMIPYTIV